MTLSRLAGMLFVSCLAGCVGSGETAGVAATQPVAASTTPEKSGMHIDILFTSMTTNGAVVEIGERLGDLGFVEPSGGTGTYNTYSIAGLPYVRPEGNDHFFAHVKALSANGFVIDAVCQWLVDGKTKVTVATNLPADQREYVMAKFRGSLDPYPPTTEPTIP
jgi:hypothetical protein